MENINREHPEYVARKAMWRKYQDLYAGGEKLRINGADYLRRRNKEPETTYDERLRCVFYENYIGSIVDWYAATLMRREPMMLFEGGDESAKDFYAVLAQDCDLKGTNLSEFFRRQFVDLLVYGSSYTVVDFPRANGPALTRAEEDASGQSRAYLVDYSAEEVINWSYDRSGGLEWVVIRTSCLQQSKVEDAKWENETRWVYYDRETFQMFRKAGEGGRIELIDEGRHALAGLRRVPLFQMRVTDGLWLMNKAALLQLEHFNKSNALSWALTMGLFATPVVYSDREWNQIVGESYYIQLGKDDRFGWTEPDGKVYQIAANNLTSLKEEIYRVCYLSQASGEMVSGHAQSALSKQMDFAITLEVLRTYSSVVKECIRQVLNAISGARQDGILIAVSGLDEVDISDFATDLQDAKDLLQVGIDSPTLKRQIYQRLALKYLNDARQEMKDQIAREINAQFSN